MAAGSQSNQTVVKGAQSAINRFKYEIANELGLNVQPGDYWCDLPAAQCGAVGGHIVRHLIELAERQLAGTR